jgi:hypothetical protein
MDRFSGAHLNRAKPRTGGNFAEISRESVASGTAWRSDMDSNSRSR